jgi:hypothetical protein
VLPDGAGLARVTRPSDAPAAERLTGSTFSALLLGLAGVVLPVSGIRVADTMVISVLEGRRRSPTAASSPIPIRRSRRTPVALLGATGRCGR